MKYFLLCAAKNMASVCISYVHSYCLVCKGLLYVLFNALCIMCGKVSVCMLSGFFDV